MRPTASGSTRFRLTTYGPPVAKSTDGKLWFLTGEGVQVVDPRHLAVNKLPPPVHIEQSPPTARRTIVEGIAPAGQCPRPGVRLHGAEPWWRRRRSASEYMLEGQDQDWREVVNERQAQYSNLPPGSYRFRVIACNNSGVWNEHGATLEFVNPAGLYQTNGSARCASSAFWPCSGRLPVPCPAARAAVQHDAGGARE